MSLDRIDRRQNLAIAAIAIGLFAVVAFMAIVGFREPPEPAITADDGIRYFGGRVEDPVAADAVRSTFAEKYFSDTPAGKAKHADEKRTVLLSDAAKKVLGRHLPARNQGQVGSCVSFGTKTAVEYVTLVQIAGGENLEYRDLSPEVIYAGGRVEVGKGRIRGDGLVGAWAAEFVKGWGVIEQGIHGRHDLSNYDEVRCRNWGRTGVPDDLEAIARKSPVKGITSVKTWNEVVNAITQGYPLAVCSDQGFSTTRDRDGFARASGTWQHCMAIIGVTTEGREGALISNSWGADWIRGPKGKHDIPDGCFWADKRTIERMVSQNDTWAFSDATGFPAREFDFFDINKRQFAAMLARRHGAGGLFHLFREKNQCGLAY